jgi:hypothetical protein
MASSMEVRTMSGLTLAEADRAVDAALQHGHERSRSSMRAATWSC